jgi:hypothetical protein
VIDPQVGGKALFDQVIQLILEQNDSIGNRRSRDKPVQLR